MTARHMLLSLTLSVALSTAMAQCERKTDDMTGKVSIVSKPVAITGIGVKGAHSIYPFRVYAVRQSDTTTLYMRISVKHEITLDEGTVVFFEMGSDSLELRTVAKSTSDMRETGLFGPVQRRDERMYFNVLAFPLTRQQVDKLKANPVTGITVDKEDYDVSRSHQSLIADILRCLDSK